MKRAKRKRVIQFEYRDGIIEGGIYEPKLKKHHGKKYILELR